METIKESMAQMNKIFNDKLAEFEERQQKISSSKKATPAPSPCESDLAADFSIFKSFVMNALRTLQCQVELLCKQCDSIEMHTRRKILLVHGIPEDPKEDLVPVIVKLVSQTLKQGDFKANDISRCHRMGGLTSSGRPRPILFKLSDVSVRSKIWSAKSCLRGSGITLSEFLTKARHDVFMAARQRFGISKCWTRDGSVYVVDTNDVRHRVSCIAELERIEAPTETAPVAGSSAAIAKKTESKQSERLQKQKKLKLVK